MKYEILQKFVFCFCFCFQVERVLVVTLNLFEKYFLIFFSSSSFTALYLVFKQAQSNLKGTNDVTTVKSTNLRKRYKSLFTKPVVTKPEQLKVSKRLIQLKQI